MDLIYIVLFVAEDQLCDEMLEKKDTFSVIDSLVIDFYYFGVEAFCWIGWTV